MVAFGVLFNVVPNYRAVDLDFVPTGVVPLDAGSVRDAIEETYEELSQEITAKDSFEWTQTTAAAVWTIPHNLGYKPNVSTFNALNSPILGMPSHINNNTLQITFDDPVDGIAVFNLRP